MASQTIQVERIDDIPLLFYQLQKMNIPALIDKRWDQHGNWQGLSKGWMTLIWLIYILSESDHRMIVVEDWVKSKEKVLSQLCGRKVRAKDFTSDRLAKVLKAFSDDMRWEGLEEDLGQHLIRVYELKKKPIRVDSTSVSVHHEVQEGGLFQFGYSKDHRPDLAQFKIMLASLDPMGFPLASLIAPGHESDEKEYLPVIERARKIVGKGGQLYIGDSKMSALALRTNIVQAGDYYLVPLPRRHQGQDELDQWVKVVCETKKKLSPIILPEDKSLWALGYEKTRKQTTILENETVKWQERVLVIFRPSLARQERASLQSRLKRAEKELKALARQKAYPEAKWESNEAMQTAAQLILEKHRVEGLLEVTCWRTKEEYKARGSKEKTTRIREHIRIQRQGKAIREKRQLLGWRLYVTNAPRAALPMEEAILSYRQAPTIEQIWRRTKGRPLGLHPVYTQREDHTKGLARLLLMAIDLLALVEFSLREALQLEDEPLSGIFPGQAYRSTRKPTTERLLQAFRGIDRVIIESQEATIFHVTPLSSTQERILALLDFPADLYQNLGLNKQTHPP